MLVVGAGTRGSRSPRSWPPPAPVDLSIATTYPMLPQRRAGRDLFWWLTRLGLLRVTVNSARPADEPPGLCDRDQPAAGAAGVRFRPRLVDAEGRTVRFADHSLLEDVGVVVWATGYRSDYAWIHIPGVVREAPCRPPPWRDRGARPVLPGPVLAAHPRSALLGFVNDDAAYLAERIATRLHRRVGHGQRHPAAVADQDPAATTAHRKGRRWQPKNRRRSRSCSTQGITLLDMVGPLQVFSVLQGFNDQYRPVVVAERIEPMPTDTPLTVIADKTFDEVPDPAVVLVPGGGAPTIKAMGDPVIRDYLRRVAGTSGAGWIGLHRGHDPGRGRARGPQRHHPLVPPPPAGAPGATYLPDRWVEDGKVITSAGVSAGIDLALALVARLTDEPTARMVQLWIEYDPHPPFGGIDWTQVDRDMAEPVVTQWVQTQLADRPDLLAKLSG